MAFDPYPTGYFMNICTTGVLGTDFGYAADTTGVFIPYEDLESFDYDVAISESGDIRQLIYSFVEAVTDRYLDLDSVDRPSRISITRTSTVPTDDTIRKVYGFTINVALGPTEVIPE